MFKKKHISELIFLTSIVVIAYYFSIETSRSKDSIKNADQRLDFIDSILFKFENSNSVTAEDLLKFKTEYQRMLPKTSSPKFASISPELPPIVTLHTMPTENKIQSDLLEEKIKNIENKLDALERAQWSPWVVFLLIPLLTPIAIQIFSPLLNDLGVRLRNKVLSEKV